MERILVGMDNKITGLWSVIYALNLAKRLKLKISVLLVLESKTVVDGEQILDDDESSIKNRLEKLIEEGRLQAIPIDYYIAYGSFKDELIRFIQEKKINLLVLDLPLTEKRRGAEKFPDLLGEIKLRTDCTIEVVHKKNIESC